MGGRAFVFAIYAETSPSSKRTETPITLFTSENCVAGES